jgi:hypothetical protein
MIKYFFLLSAFIFVSCSNKQKQRVSIVNNVKSHDIIGEVVINGIDDLLRSNDFTILDSLVVIRNAKEITKHGAFFYIYGLYNFKKKCSFGSFGSGPEDFSYPVFFKTEKLRNSGNSFSVMDLNLSKISHVTIANDFTHINFGKVTPNLLFSFNLNQVNDSVFYGTKTGGDSKGLYFQIDISQDQITWVDYSAQNENKIRASRKYELYSNTLCVNKEMEVVAVALRYFNKILFFDYYGALLKEIQIGQEELFPAWDKNEDFISSSSRSYFLDLSITNKYIYGLWVENHDGKKHGDPSSKVFVFDWKYRYIATLNLDYPAYRIRVSNQDSFILSLVDDGTGLTNVVKYDIQSILKNK